MTRNIGLCVHMKYMRHFHNILSSRSLHHQFYTRHNDSIITSIIENNNPDVIIVQEVASNKDFEHLRQLLDNYPHSYLYQSYHHTHNKVIFSKEIFKYHTAIIEKHTVPYISYDNWTIIIPIHLSAFSPKKRYEQIQRIIRLIDQQWRKKYILAGDFNIWHIKNYFLSLKDKKSYTILSSRYQDCGKDAWTTSIIWAKFDKIFCSHWAHIVSSKVIYERGTYMDHYPLISELEFSDK